jgi:exodeoxyribonuclease VII small subunit
MLKIVPMSETRNEMTFEAALERLQQTVRRLESGELSLEDSLKSFEEGVRLTRHCQEQLKVAEQRIELLTQVSADGKVETAPFTPGRG